MRHSGHAHASYPGLPFPSGVQSQYSEGKKELRDWDSPRNARMLLIPAKGRRGSL